MAHLFCYKNIMTDYFNKKIKELIEQPIKSLGFELVSVSLKGSLQYKTLEILIEDPTGVPISIKNCTDVSKNIKVILDVEELIKSEYKLEVSSAGLERPLIKLEDYERFLNHEIKIKLKQPLNGSLNLKGKITQIVDSQIFIKFYDQEISIPFDLIKNANLILTDERFRQMLNQK